MYFNPFSRRHLLRGTGAGLMLPLLPSLMPRALAAAAAAPAVRYVQFVSPYGTPGEYFFPKDDGLAQTPAGIFARPLAGIAGDVSPQFGPAFSGFKNKMSLVRGLHVLVRKGEQHNASYATCASDVNNNNDPNTSDNYPGFYPYSVDAVLASSNKVYPDATGLQRHVNFCPDAKSLAGAPKVPGYRNFSWARMAGGRVQHMPNTTATDALLAKFMQLGKGAPGSAPAADPLAARKADILQGVYADYKAVRDNPRMSADDRLRFDGYISLIDSVQKNLTATGAGGGSCASPSQESESDYTARLHNQLRILAAALACGLTRVASVVLVRPDSGADGHTIHHDKSNLEVAAYQKPNIDQIGFFLGLLDSVSESNGTLLENSIVLHTNEFGERFPGNVTGHIHTHKNMLVMLAGGGAGRLRMGQYIDYRKTNSRPYNNLLVSIYNAMGLGSSDYERENLIGVGDYEAPFYITMYGFQDLVTTPERRKPLPFLYTGPTLG